MSPGELSQRARRSSIGATRSDPLSFSQCYLHQLCPDGTKAQLAIKPKCARFDSLFVFVADLIRIDREDRNAQKLAHQTQDAAEEPGRLAFAKCVIEVEAALQALKDRQSFEVRERHAILQNQCGVIGAQGQAIFGPHAKHESFGAAAERSLEHPTRVAKGEAVQFAI